MSASRYKAFLLLRYRILGGYAGLLYGVIGLVILSPIVLIPVYSSESYLAAAFLLPGLGLALTGLLLWKILRPPPNDVFSLAEGSVLVVMTWSAAILMGAVPFYWAGLDWVEAVFEATSGWTTTGLSVVDIEKVSPLLLFYRSVLQLAGGAGFAILMLSMVAGPSGLGLSAAEGRGDLLVPQVRQSARLVVTLYSLYAVFGILALKIAGMDWFDAVNHSFSALSTGGFSTRAASIGFWNSPAIEAVLIVLMLLGTMNFLTGYTLWCGHWRAVLRNGEIQVMAVLLTLTPALLFFGGTCRLSPTLFEQARSALFQAVSALSTTGFATVDFADWNAVGWLIVIILMLIGGGTGSTAGGIKQQRIYILGKLIKSQLSEIMLPAKTIREEAVWFGNHRHFLEARDLWTTAAYVGLYFFSWLAGGCALAAFGYPLADSLFEFASVLGTVGLSAGLTSATAPDGLLWVESLGMFLGRLEFFAILWGIIKIGQDLSAMMKRP